MPSSSPVASLADGLEVLAGQEPGGAVVVPVQEAVPPWLAELVTRADAVGVTVVVRAEGPPARAGSTAGWQIGVATAALAAGAAVDGVDGRVLARVAAVDERWAER